MLETKLPKVKLPKRIKRDIITYLEIARLALEDPTFRLNIEIVLDLNCFETKRLFTQLDGYMTIKNMED